MTAIREAQAAEVVHTTPAELQRVVGEEIRQQREEITDTAIRDIRVLELAVLGSFTAQLVFAAAGVAIWNALRFVMPGWAAGLVLIGIYAIMTVAFLAPVVSRLIPRIYERSR